jgi:hypothetical protein
MTASAEVFFDIFAFFDINEVDKCQLVSKKWKEFGKKTL